MIITINLPTSGVDITEVSTVTTEVSALKLLSVRDSAKNQEISVRINKVHSSFYVWKGAEQYTSQEASTWNNETVLARAIEILTLSADHINWV